MAAVTFESLTVKIAYVLLMILAEDKLAAPSKVIFPSPTVTIISLPLFSVEWRAPEISSVEVELKPSIVSLPSPVAY